jgi:hypothetical protein
MVCGLFYCLNFKYLKELGYKTTRLDIVSIERSSSISGSISGNGSIIYEQVSGKVTKSDYYDLYYSLNSGGKTFLSIPAAGIPIYSVKDGETPYLLKIEDYRYFEDCNVKPAREFWPEVSVRYELYLPEGAIIEKYQLNNF